MYAVVVWIERCTERKYLTYFVVNICSKPEHLFRPEWMRLKWFRKSSPNLGKDDINWLAAQLEIRQNGWGPVLVSLHSYCHIALRAVLRYPLYARGGEDVWNTLAVRGPVADITSGFVTYFLVLSLHFICLSHIAGWTIATIWYCFLSGLGPAQLGTL